MPLILKNDSICTAFQFLIEFDTAWLTPVFIKDSACAEADSLGECIDWNIDSSFIDHLISGRFVRDSVYPGPFGNITDTVTKFQALLFQEHENIVAGNFLPNFEDFDSLPPGSDTIFYLKFIADSAMPHEQLAEFTFFEEDIYTVDESVYPPETTWYNGCNESQMTVAWEVVPDSTENYQFYPTTQGAFPYYFRADTGYVDTATVLPTVNFAASPSTIDYGQSTSLIWTSANADSVVILDGASVRLTHAANGQTAGSIPLSGLSIGTHNYMATAYGEGNTAVGYATVTVQDPGGGDGPVITITGNQTNYSQGELISFTVRATNTNSSQITLSASSLPANASFGTGGQVIGFTPLSGTFGWTPDLSQEGSFTIQFVAADADGTSYSSAYLQIEALPYDRLYSTSTQGNQPTGGLPGAGGVAFPIDLVTAQTVYGIQFDMLYPHSVIRVDSFTTSVRIPDYVVYDNIGVTPGEIRVVTFGLNNEPVLDTNTTAVLYAIMTLDSAAVPWDDHPIYLEDGRESINPDPGVGSLPLITDSGIVQIDRYGDVNLDKIIDVADVVNIVAYIIGNFDLTVRQFATADIITNDEVNVFDLVADINFIYDILPSPSPSPVVPGAEAVMSLAYGDLAEGSSDLLTVSSEIPEQVAGVQLELNYNPSAVMLGTPRLTQHNEKFILQSKDDGDGHLKLLLYHMAPFKSDELIQAGVVELVDIPITARTDISAGDKTTIRLTEALLATAEAASIAVTGVDNPILPSSFSLHQNYPNPFNPTTTISFYVGVPPNGAGQRHVNLRVFNILGQEVKMLADESMATGQEYDVVWDATDAYGQRIASGVYLYRLEMGDESETKKMLFLK